ncbi:hypothetical protein [Mesorhizobium sp.]|uniref:hypothetical protein n=1 Tax=Mesorhizobium sp. TaxID=1871066 RepID=UPI0025F81B0C|nr:hypothetical protein [Mesorhizobium sp.]
MLAIKSGTANHSSILPRFWRANEFLFRSGIKVSLIAKPFDNQAAGNRAAAPPGIPDSLTMMVTVGVNKQKTTGRQGFSL